MRWNMAAWWVLAVWSWGSLCGILTIAQPVPDSGGSSNSPILGAPVVGDEAEEEAPLPPPELAPLSLPEPPPPAPTPTATPLPPPQPSPTRTHAVYVNRTYEEDKHREEVPKKETPFTFRSVPSRGEVRSLFPAGVVVEYQPAGGDYRPAVKDNLRIEDGERLRWKYPGDETWRVLEAYGATVVQLFPHHYEIGGDFFHSFRHGNYRIQVPTLDEARSRRVGSVTLRKDRLYHRLFVEIDSAAPKAPRPEGNCVVWQKEKLWLNDLVSGEIDSVVSNGRVDHLALTSLTPGMIYVLAPPSNVVTYAVRVDFEHEIFANLGWEKGLADAELERMRKLYQVADTDARRLWCQARMAYEEERSRFLEEEKQFYDIFFDGELDEFNLIRSGHPKPHLILAKVDYRHENLALSVTVSSNHVGQILVLANALLWINETVPLTGTPFTFEITDGSDPAFIGFDTRFRSDGKELLAEERSRGSDSWVPRDVVIDLYTYASFRPPQPGGPPEYLLDVTMDITGGLKRLDQQMIVNGRLGTIQLTPDLFRIDLAPQVLISPVPMNKLIRNIMIGPLDLKGWIMGRRKRIHDLFNRFPVLPNELLNEIEGLVDEMGMRVYEVELEQRKRSFDWRFEPAGLSVTLSRLPTPGRMLLQMVLTSEDDRTATVSRTITPGVDLINYAASSVMANRLNTSFHQFRRMTLDEWKSLSQGNSR